MIREQGFAKVNLVLQVGRPRDDGLHPLCSLFGSVELADELTLEEASRDELVCSEVGGQNLAARALAAFRAAAPDRLPPLRVEIEKRVPVAAGLGGGSADAAAVLRGANELAGKPLDAQALRALAAKLGSDVPSQVEPGHALVSGAGEEIEPLELPAAAVLLVPAAEGLSTAETYAQLDRMRGWRERLEPERLRALAASPLPELAAAVENDLQRAALALRPELEGTLATLRGAGAIAAALTGSGPTAFGLFGADEEAQRAAEGVPDSIVTRLRPSSLGGAG